MTEPHVEEDEEYGSDWVCHSCADGGKTPWDPAVGCPRYPCHAHKRAEMNLCPVCYGWIL